MMRVRFHFWILLLGSNLISFQMQANNWHSYLSYYQVIAITQGDQQIFAANQSGLFAYHLTDKSFTSASTVEGLSDNGITAISYSAVANGVLIGYNNGNLDILAGKSVRNLPYIKIKPSIVKKTINNILTEGDFAWLSCDFGIVKINLRKWEVAETWIIGPQATAIAVKDFTADDTYFWAATEAGLYKAAKNNPNLQDFHSWELQEDPLLFNKSFSSVATYQGRILVCDSDGHCYSFTGGVWQQGYLEITGIQKIKASPSGVMVISDARVDVFTDNSQRTITNYGNLTSKSVKIYPQDLLISSSGELWIGDHVFGLVNQKTLGTFELAVPASPADNHASRLQLSEKGLYVATASSDPEVADLPAAIHRLKQQQWFSINEYTQSDLSGLRNITQVVPSPLNDEHFWASTRGDGLLEFEGLRMVKNYNSTNSTLAAFNGKCQTGGLALDKAGNLWITNPFVQNQLHLLKPDGTFKPLHYPGIDNQFEAAGEIIISQTDTKWIIVNNSDLFALKTGATSDNSSDDQYRKTSVRSRFSNSETTIIKGHNQLNALVEDHNGYLWAGTENGVVLYSDPESLFGDTDFYGIQPSVDYGDGLFHPLLDNQSITTIAIDGGNRKWFGTTNSGVYLYSEDGSQMITHFDTENSPLFSNHINNIAIDNRTGEVFFATDQGLLSYSGDATSGEKTFNHLFVWPNPVRETFHGDITIDGLTADSEVKITDITGKLIYKSTSNGGRATWNGRARNGERVNTGVYLIFCSTSDGAQSRVIKLLLIH
jgi:ligand-binding sensor domain-containing protein